MSRALLASVERRRQSLGRAFAAGPREVAGRSAGETAAPLDTANEPSTCAAASRSERRRILTAPLLFDIFRIMKSQEAIASLAALAQESRLAIFRLLVRRGPEGYTPTQLSEKLSVSPPTLSFHLKELQRARLVDVRRDGRFLYYRPSLSHMNRLVAFLTENCCVLAEQGCNPECAPAVVEAALPRKRRA